MRWISNVRRNIEDSDINIDCSLSEARQPYSVRIPVLDWEKFWTDDSVSSLERKENSRFSYY